MAAIPVPTVVVTAAMSPDNKSILFTLGTIKTFSYPVSKWVDMTNLTALEDDIVAWEVNKALKAAGVNPLNAATSLAWLAANPSFTYPGRA